MQSDSKLKVTKHQLDSESEEEEEEEEGVALELFAGHTPLGWRSDGGKKERRRRKKRKLDKETRVVLERQEVGCCCFLVSENVPGVSCCSSACHPHVSCSHRPMLFVMLTESMSVALTFQMLLEALSSLKLLIIFRPTS